MSPADLRRRWTAARGSTLAAALCSLSAALLLTCSAMLGAPAPVAAAAPASGLIVTMDRLLTQVGDSVALTLSGDALTALSAEATIEVRVTGPATLAQVTQPSPSLRTVGSFSVTVGSLPGAARPGSSQIRLPIPATSLPLYPGAYRVTVQVGSGGAVVASAGAWMGRIAPRTSPLDLCFVWRAELGIHRDSAGRFFDRVLADACAAGGALAGLAGLDSRFPEWRFTLGIEPVLLTQLRDMADGYTLADGSETGAAVTAEDLSAQDAQAVLKSLAAAAGRTGVQVAAAPYAGADMGLLGTQEWRDGFDQIQLGKQELIQTLGLGLPPAGAYSPGLDLSSGSLGDYGRASVDHLLVDARVTAGLNEPVDRGTVTVRAHDEANDRVTLVLAHSELRALIASPWDPSVLFAGVAAVLASGDHDALVLTTAGDFTLPPQAYLDAIGAELEKDPWLRTQTMSDLLKSHPPDTRPVLLTRDPDLPSGYIGQTTFSAIQAAHAAVDALAVAADPASLPLEAARRSLYLAESRWWWRAGVSPDEASAGLGYATRAQAIAEDQLSAVGLAGMKDSLIFGRDGAVTISVTNGGESAMTVELRLTGEGLSFPEGDVVEVRLEPGTNGVVVPVTGSSKTRDLAVRLVVGGTDAGEQKASLRFITAIDILPWIGLAVLVIILIVMTTILLRNKKKHRLPPDTSGRRRTVRR